jgi:hypothetical protein
MTQVDPARAWKIEHGSFDGWFISAGLWAKALRAVPYRAVLVGAASGGRAPARLRRPQ